MDKTVARLNIEYYRRPLASETDESRRQVIMRRLAEKEAKLVDSKPQERKRRPRQSRIDSEQSKPGPELGPGGFFGSCASGLGPCPPMGRTYVQPLLGFRIHPPVENAPARKN
jgi:hypothetical protein